MVPKSPVSVSSLVLLDQIILNGQSNQGDDREKFEAISEKCLRFKTKIGHGESGDVHLAKIIGSRLTGRFSAVKVIRKLILNKQAKEDYVKREQTFLRELKHPFIAQMYFSFQTTYLLFMGMEFLQGGDLLELRQQQFYQVLPENWVKFYASQIILVLEYLHQQDIVHRDLKPENVMIAADGYIRLIDFGVSLVTKDNDICGIEAGANEFMAPEVLNDSGHGKPSDWWSLGILCYDLLYGNVPFKFDVKENRMTNYNLKFPNDILISNSAKEFITALLIQEPNTRLGGRAGVSEVKNHPFVENTDWIRLLSKRIKPPFVPEFTSSADITHFDPAITSCADKKPRIGAKVIRERVKKEAFSDFHYEIDPNDIFAAEKPQLSYESSDDEDEVAAKRPKFNDVAESMDPTKFLVDHEEEIS